MTADRHRGRASSTGRSARRAWPTTTRRHAAGPRAGRAGRHHHRLLEAVKRRPGQAALLHPPQRRAGAVPGRHAAGGLPSREQEARDSAGAGVRTRTPARCCSSGSCRSGTSPAIPSPTRRTRPGRCRRRRPRRRPSAGPRGPGAVRDDRRLRPPRAEPRNARAARWRSSTTPTEIVTAGHGRDVAHLQPDGRHAPDPLPLLQRAGPRSRQPFSLAGGTPNFTGNPMPAGPGRAGMEGDGQDEPRRVHHLLVEVPPTDGLAPAGVPTAIA